MKSINPSGSRKSSRPTRTLLKKVTSAPPALRGKNDEAAAHLEEAVRILKTTLPAP